MMNESWSTEYKRALLVTFIEEAMVASNKPYTIFDYNRTNKLRRHMSQCDVDITWTPMPVDSTWTEFKGTFTDDRIVYGMNAKITCLCGEFRVVEMYWNKSFSDLLWGVLRNR